MAGNENLARLATSLSMEERQNLLEKLKGNSLMLSEVLYFEESGHNTFLDFQGQYAALPWYSRLLFFIQSLFTGISPLKAFEDKFIANLGHQIEEASPGLYDYQRARLLTPFHIHLGRLKEAARFFFDALDMGFNRDKGAFYAFLGSLEMPSVHRKLMGGASPHIFMEQYPEASEAEIRRLCFEAMETALEGVTETYRAVMYQDARSLLCLKQLTSFLFDRVMMAFTSDHSTGGQSCPVNVVREQLISLNNILFSLRTIPSMSLLESLFVFLLQEKPGAPGFDIDKEISSLLMKAETSLAAIREFNKQIPLTKVIRCGVRDMSIVPREIPGGEDWFVAYREYWKRFIESAYSEYVRNRRQRELLEIFKFFFGGKSLRALENAASDTNPKGFPLRGDFGLSFLLTFYSAIFIPDLNMLLRPILVDGEFARKENEMEFADAYNEFMKLENDIIRLDAKISHAGDYGKRYALAQQEVAALPVKRRKVQIVIEEASSESLGIIDGIRKASRCLVEVINGILNKDNRGTKTDGLANLEKISGTGTVFIEGLGAAIGKFQAVVKILDDIDLMEMG